MKILERYILRRMLSVFFGALGAVLAIAWTSQALTRINLVTDTGQSMTTFMQLATMLLPAVIPVIAPFAVVMAVALTFSSMNTDSELAVINAAGSSRWTFAGPALLLGLAASITVFVVDNGVEPFSRQNVRKMIASANADLFSSVIQEGTFRKLEDGLYVQIGERLSEGRLGGIFVADSRDPNVDLIYYAREGALVRQDGGSVLVMRDGEVHRKTPGGDVSVISFNSYAFDLSALAPATDRIFLYPKDQTLAYLLNPDPNDPVFKQRPQFVRAELHRRFTQWLYPLVFALIALAAAGDARSHREGGVHPMVTALTVSLLVLWLGYFAGNQAETKPAYSAAIYAVPISASAGATAFILANRRMNVPVSWSDRFGSLVAILRERIVAFKVWQSGFKRSQGRGA